MFGFAMPSWLLNSQVVLLRRFVRNTDEPICDPVELLSANPTYARRKFCNARESTISTSDLVPCPQMEQRRPISQNSFDTSPSETALQVTDNLTVGSRDDTLLDTSTSVDVSNSSNADDAADCVPVPILRRSTRTRPPPQRFGDSINRFVTTAYVAFFA